MKDAIDIALHFLKFRPRTVFEIEKKLKEKKISQDEIDKTIRVLKQNKLLDDDIRKDGMYYANLPLKICNYNKVNNRMLKNSSVLITAVDNVKPLMIKLLSNRVRNIIYPFHVI